MITLYILLCNYFFFIVDIFPYPEYKLIGSSSMATDHSIYFTHLPFLPIMLFMVFSSYEMTGMNFLIHILL